MTLPPRHPLPVGNTDIRRATPADVPACADILNDWIDAHPWVPRCRDHAAMAEALHAALKNRIVWVLGDCPHAFLSLDAASSVITALYVRSPGHGHGTALLDMAKAHADMLTLTMHLPNLRAQSFFRRNGFLPVGDYEPFPGADMKSIHLEWWRAA